MVTKTYHVYMEYKIDAQRACTLTKELRDHVTLFTPHKVASCQGDADLPPNIDVTFLDADEAAEYELAVLTILDDNGATIVRTPEQTNNHYCRSNEPWPQTLALLEELLDKQGYKNCTGDEALFSSYLDKAINCYRRHFCIGSCCDAGPNIDIGCNTPNEYLITDIQYNDRYLTPKVEDSPQTTPQGYVVDIDWAAVPDDYVAMDLSNEWFAYKIPPQIVGDTAAWGCSPPPEDAKESEWEDDEYTQISPLKSSVPAEHWKHTVLKRPASCFLPHTHSITGEDLECP